jgi:hypothetical protein
MPKKETILENPRQNKTKQKHNTLTSLLKNPEGFVFVSRSETLFLKDQVVTNSDCSEKILSRV